MTLGRGGRVLPAEGGPVQAGAARRAEGRSRSRSTTTAVHGSLRRPAHPLHRAHQGDQAAERRRRVLARGREEQDAAADLWHHVPERRRSSTSTSSGSKRRSGATTGSSERNWSCSCSRRRSGAGSRSGCRKGRSCGRRSRHSCARSSGSAATCRWSPRISANLNLYRTSGHYPYYKDSQFAPIKVEDEEYLLKPMNCPHHHQIYLAKPRSYRDLPHPACGVRHGVPVRAVGRAERAHAGALVHGGRFAHVRAAGPAQGRALRRDRPDPAGLRDAGIQGIQDTALLPRSEEQGEVRRRGRALGAGREGHQGRPRTR